ncbi:hypothetical protein [Methylobacterium gnaphalii]|uniref:Uncharacterized protein n=1 Tax=Methylobacterium gnaphalii TaxID=1010610 RepID=A0A512JP08_9HYPH|nr:hypothetical protein [Methylobacterium gnaphalii]GEP11694.1 hypothetical protein MGN01_35390 [Methylobacterium gnaphalii]GJD68791.1 hypothetical protein MMMDOFMJ_1715 [Methylobacterium gnaphalii]
MNGAALALSGFVFVGLSVGAMIAIPLLIRWNDLRERRRGGWHG